MINQVKHRFGNLRVSKKVVALLLFALTSTLVLVFSQELDATRIFSAFERFNKTALVSALFFVLAQVILQGTRFWILLPRDRRPSWTKLFALFSMGQWVNLFAPARAGDVMKVVLLSSGKTEQSSSPRLSVVTSTASLIADKLIDVIALVTLLVVTRSIVPALSWNSTLPVFPILIAVAVLAGVLYRFALPRFANISKEWKANIASALVVLKDRRVLAMALTLGVLAWLSECFVLHTLCGALGYQIPLSGLIRALAILNLGIAVPVTLANLGPFEAALAFSLSRYDVPASEALAIASAHHLLQMSGVSLLAFVSWSGQKLSRILSQTLSRRFGVSEGDKKKAIGYYAGLSNQYNSRVEKGILKTFRERERGMVLSFAEMGSGRGSMIDVGCGGGFYALAAKQAGMSVCAVDAVPEMLDSLRPLVDRVEVVDVEHMADLGLYDLVICAGVLDFTTHPEQAFRNLSALLSPSGRLVILAPRAGLGGLIYRIEKWILGISVNGFSRSWLMRQAEKNSLSLLRVGHPLPTNFVAEFRRAPAEA